MSVTTRTVLGEATVQELREAVRGSVITPSDEGYPDASRIWNGAHDHRPALIVRCTGAADVIAAVGLARSHDLRVAVRGGGHSLPGFSSCDGGVVIDLSPMRTVRVDLDARRAYVAGGALWADVDHETQAHGLATTGGLVSTTGVAGYTLGGGIGWLMRRYGLACDNLVGADVVTADGRLLHASDDQNPELMWGLRGGGGNFGVVTQFELALHPVGPVVHAGLIIYPADRDADLLRTLRDWAPHASRDVTAVVNLTTAPPLPVIPQAWHGQKVAIALAVSAGPVDEAPPHVQAFRDLGDPIVDLLGPMPYRAMQSLIDALWVKGTRAYFKATNLSGLDDALIEQYCRLHLAAPGPLSEIHVHQMGGAVADVAEDATAFPQRSMPFLVNAVAGWQQPADDEPHRSWARAVIDASAGASTGRSYVNYLGDPDAARTAYGDATYARLAALKARYDPTNVFRLNQNIAPATDG